MNRLLLVLCFIVGLDISALASSDRIKIGVLADMSGLLSDIAGRGSVEAVRMAVEDAGNDVAGKPVEVVFADHQNKVDIGASIARKWLDAEGVDMIVDIQNASIALAVRQIARDRGKVDIVTGAAVMDLTGSLCSDTGFHWVLDTYSLAKSMTLAASNSFGRKWFFLTADYAFGHAMEAEATRFLKNSGGESVGRSVHPLGTSDFASFLLQAQASRANVIALANAGNDTIQSIKQASEFGLTQGGQKIAALLLFISDVHAIGLPLAQGLVLTEAFYWDLDESTRAFARRFMERTGRAPTSIQAGDYSATRHYLRAVSAEGSTDGRRVAARMRAMPVDDFFGRGGQIRRDGRLIHDMYLMEVKKPAESKYPWDYYRLVQTISGVDAVRPLRDGGCPLANEP